MVLSQAARTAWAKSGRDDLNRLDRWLPLWRHMDDAQAVAELLWDRWLPPQTRRMVGAPIPEGEEDARRLVALLSAAHDIGKATPAFAVREPRLRDAMVVAGLPMPASIPLEERRRLPHGLAGQAVLRGWLSGTHGWGASKATALAVVVGGHHGIPPDIGDDAVAEHRPDLLGEGTWTALQRELLDRAARRSGAAARLSAWSSVRLPQPVQVALSGLVIMADWIASNETLFGLSALDDQPPGDDGRRVPDAWASLGLPGPWRPVPTAVSPAALFARRFPSGGRFTARPVQQAAVEVARTMDLPGLLIGEASMGEGKTEASLLAAEVIAARTGAGGIFFALPTQATSDAIFERVLAWLSHLADVDASGADGERSGSPPRRSVALMHGKASLNASFRALRIPGGATGVGVDEAGTGPGGAQDPGLDVVVDAWLSGRKKSVLADFVIATIDQLLFVALRARHLALRHLGLAGKVVVIDEVHAYDAWMNVYLARALEWLGASGVSVVMLSATLPAATREALADAYRRGRDSGRPPARPRRSSWAPARAARGAPGPAPSPPAGAAYPAWSTLGAAGLDVRPVEASGRRSEVALELLGDDLGTLVATLDLALGEGGCALVVRNTVTRAAAAADALAQHFGKDHVTLAHARFMAFDRLTRDAWLRRCFGPPDEQGRSRARPRLHVVVATQVVEQSLDLDFDLLVTDLAPIDLVLQRIGRLHRHVRGSGESDRPAGLRSPRCLIAGAGDWRGEPPAPDRGSQKVYTRSALLRAAAILVDRSRSGGHVLLPEDIAPWVQTAYGPHALGPPAWRPSMERAAREEQRIRRDKEAGARAFLLPSPGPVGRAITGWLHGTVGEADDSGQGQAQVRDSGDSIEVLALPRADGHYRIPDHSPVLPGELLPVNAVPGPAAARAMLACAVRLPWEVCVGEGGDRVVDALEAALVPEWQRSPWLRGQLVLPLDDPPGEPVACWRFRYDPNRGLEASRA